MHDGLSRHERRILSRLSSALCDLWDAQAKYNAAKEEAIAFLKTQEVGRHPAIDHHIINTEQRVLSEEEKQIIHRNDRS